jgi:drug/metabolite transporter (DMT)-like permease
MTPSRTKRRILSTTEGVNRGEFTDADWGLFGGVAVIWGGSFLLMDVGLDAFEPGLVTWLRVVLGAAVLWMVPEARRPVAAEDRGKLVALSIIWVGIPFTLFPIAQQHVNSAITGMLNGAMPIFAAAIAGAILVRWPRRITLFGILVGSAGVIAISVPSIGEGSSQALGVSLVVLATACYGLAVNIAAPLQQRYGALPVMARMLALAILWTSPLGVVGLKGSSFAWGPLAAIAIAGIVGTGIAFALMASLVGRVGATRASFIAYGIPVVALVLGVVFRNDDVTAPALVGIVLVLVGAVFASRRGN